MKYLLRNTAAMALAAAPYLYAEPDGGAAPNDPDFALQWGLENTGQVVEGQPGIVGADIDALGAWAIYRGTSNVVVAIVGRGVDPHPEFSDRLLEGAAFSGDLFDTLDTCTHDTHLAGIIAATTDDGAGVAGVCSTAKILPVRSFDGCTGTPASVAQGITGAVDQGADVILVPVHFDDPDSALETAVTYASANDALVVASVGSAGAATVTYPAAYPSCLAVAATTNQDGQSSYSNFGAAVDVSAPGRAIWSTWSNGGYGLLGLSRDTAAAAAHVAGLASLIRSYAPQLSESEVRQLIIDTVDDLGPAGWDAAFGSGRVNAAAAMKSAPLPAMRFEHVAEFPSEFPPDQVNSITTRIVSVGERLNPPTLRISYQVDGGQALQASAVSLGLDEYRFDLPVMSCESTIEYHFVVESTIGTVLTDPPDAPARQYSATAVIHETLFYDDFETDLGWTTVGGDNTSGMWTRAIPVGTSAQPAYDRSPDAGRSCFITGQHFGGHDGTNDVDNGPVVLTSPQIAIDSSSPVEIRFWSWVSSTNGVPDSLLVEVSRNGGVDWAPVDLISHAAMWEERTFLLDDLPQLSGDTLRLRFSIADAPNDSLTEAAVDEVEVRAIRCGLRKGDANLDGSVTTDDWYHVPGCYLGPAAPYVDPPCVRLDFNDDTRIDLRDAAAFQNANEGT